MSSGINSDPERRREYQREWYKNLSEEKKQKRREQRLAWGNANKEKLKLWRTTSDSHTAWRKSRRDKETEVLSDVYIKQILKIANIPTTPENIELKRIELKLKRKIKEITDQLKTHDTPREDGSIG